MILVADNVVNHFQFLILIDFSSSGTIFYHFHQTIPFFLEAAILGCALGKPRKDFVKYCCLLVGHTLEETMEEKDI